MSFTKNRRKIERQIENKMKNNEETAGFFSLQRNNVRWGTTTLMTSSKDNKDSSLPHAASRLVLYTKLKKGDKKQQTKREKEQRKKKKKRSRKEQGGSGFWGGDGGASGGSGSELAGPFGSLWCPSLSGGAGGQWVMVQARKLSGISVCVYMCFFCMWSFPPVAELNSNLSHTVWVRWRSFECDLFSPDFRLFTFQTVFHSQSPDWHLYELG